MDNFHAQISSEPKYAQLVSSIVSPYDVTLIFHQVRPVQSEPGNIEKFVSSSQEVARIVLSHKAAKELSDVLNGQFGNGSLGNEKRTFKKSSK